jgi:hypothetical protein
VISRPRLLQLPTPRRTLPPPGPRSNAEGNRQYFKILPYPDSHHNSTTRERQPRLENPHSLPLAFSPQIRVIDGGRHRLPHLSIPNGAMPSNRRNFFNKSPSSRHEADVLEMLCLHEAGRVAPSSCQGGHHEITGRYLPGLVPLSKFQDQQNDMQRMLS